MTKIIEEHFVIPGGKSRFSGRVNYPHVMWKVADRLPAKFLKELKDYLGHNDYNAREIDIDILANLGSEEVYLDINASLEMKLVIHSYYDHYVDIHIKNSIATMSTKDIIISGKEYYEVTESLDSGSGLRSSFTVNDNTGITNRYPSLDSHSIATFTFVDGNRTEVRVINNEINVRCEATINSELGKTQVELSTFNYSVSSDLKSYQIDHAITADELRLLTCEMREYYLYLHEM